MTLTHGTVRLGITTLEVFPVAFGPWEHGGEWTEPSQPRPDRPHRRGLAPDDGSAREMMLEQGA
jgi:hypothetical protein